MVRPPSRGIFRFETQSDPAVQQGDKVGRSGMCTHGNRIVARPCVVGWIIPSSTEAASAPQARRNYRGRPRLAKTGLPG